MPDERKSVGNRILCPDCFAVEGGEQKCCSHARAGTSCVQCGAKCLLSEGWACTGTMFEGDPVDLSVLIP